MAFVSTRRSRPRLPVLVGVALVLAAPPHGALAQQAQNPSPMVEHTRAHTRLAEARPPGRREVLGAGALFVPERLVPRRGRVGTVPLAIVFHGGDTRAGRLRVQGFAGNSAPDHVDLLHALPDLLRARE